MYINLSRPLSCHFLITSGLFLVGWIPLWGAHRWRVINHWIKQNLLFQAKGTVLCKYLMTLPTHSWDHSEFFSSILEPILVEWDYYEVKWPHHKPWILMWDQSLEHFLNKVTKSPESMIMMILPCLCFPAENVTYTTPTNQHPPEKIRQSFSVNTTFPRLWCQVNRILQEKPSARFPRAKLFGIASWLVKVPEVPQYNQQPTWEGKNPSIRIPPTRGTTTNFLGGRRMELSWQNLF